MGFLEKIYDISPICFQNIMCTVKGYINYRERYGKAYWEYREYYHKFDSVPLEEQIKIQVTQLREFIRFAKTESKFYAELYKNVNIEEIQSIEDLKKLPIVDKEMLRKHLDEIVTIPKYKAIIGHTGGTTGKSLCVRFTKDDFQKRMAMLDNFKARVGFENLKMRKATFNGKHIVPPGQKKKIFWRYNPACKQMIYSSFHLTEENMKFYVQSLNSFQPAAIDGFVTTLCDLARYIDRKGIQISFHPIAIFTTSETLTHRDRLVLEKVFGCKVYNQYASSEGAPLIAECHNQKLHIELASGVFEYLSEDDTEVLVTSFSSHGTPLIRYRIGDKMQFSTMRRCNCGLQGPIVDEISGRSSDFLYTPQGAKINSGNVVDVLKNIPNSVIQAQFIQKQMDELTVLLKVDKDLYTQSHEQIIFSEIKHKFGKEMKANIFLVDEIPKEKSGKFRMIKNNIQERNNDKLNRIID